MGDGVNPFRGFAVALKLLVPLGGKAKADFVLFQHFFIVQQIHLAVRLMHLNLGDLGAVIGLEFTAATGRDRKSGHDQKKNPENGHMLRLP